MANIDKVTLNGTDYKLIDSTVPAWAKQSTKPSYTASEISGLANVATSGSYNDLSNKPTIPTSSDINAAKPLVVTLGYSNGAYTCNTSNADIYTAWSNGRDVIADTDSGYIYHLCSTPTLATALFSGLMDELGRELYSVNTESNVQTVTYYYDSIQQNLTFDNSPTQNSNNPVKSGGVYTAVSNVKQLVVTISWGNGGLVCDTSNADIYAAWQLGKSIICTDGEFLYQMSYKPSQSVAYFGCIEADYPYCFQVVTISTSNNTQTVTVTDAANYVPQTRKVNNKALSSNITLTASDVGAVPTTRTVNGKALSSNITLSASDVGALPSNTHIPADQVQSNWNETDTSSKAYIQNKPTIPSAQVNSDWDASSGVAQILNKPTFKTINGESIVGTGDIEAGSGDVATAFTITITSTTIEVQPMTGAMMTVGTDVSFQVV